MAESGESRVTNFIDPATKLSLVEEAHRQALGRYLDRTQWNRVYVGKNNYYTVERASSENGRHFGPSDIKYTLAYEKTVNKEQCGLCRMYFNRNSMKYRVVNHRINDLQKLWNYARKGRRYESASFLYTVSSVCVFCSQLFSEVDLEKTTAVQVNIISVFSNPKHRELTQYLTNWSHFSH
jgi:hypothetical protein